MTVRSAIPFPHPPPAPPPPPGGAPPTAPPPPQEGHLAPPPALDDPTHPAITYPRAGEAAKKDAA